MLLILRVAGVAALAVIAYSRLRARSPAAADAATKAVRELAAVVLILARAAESIADTLQPRSRPLSAYDGSRWDEDGEDPELRP